MIETVDMGAHPVFRLTTVNLVIPPYYTLNVFLIPDYRYALVSTVTVSPVSVIHIGTPIKEIH